jgi:hypothetical protein
MNKPRLLTSRLIEGGFTEMGCWQLRDNAISVSLAVPPKPGVYAFAIDGIVQYVGLASKSLASRLGFYARPGSTQSTNIRLNQLITEHSTAGSTVSIHIACPGDFEWGGFRVRGAEGLEAGIIAEYEVPWNVRGAKKASSSRARIPNAPLGSRRPVTGVSHKILELIRRRPGMTELEIAKAIYGPSALQPQVNSYCRKLLSLGQVEGRGSGRHDHFIYYPTSD